MPHRTPRLSRHRGPQVSLRIELFANGGVNRNKTLADLADLKSRIARSRRRSGRLKLSAGLLNRTCGYHRWDSNFAMRSPVALEHLRGLIPKARPIARRKDEDTIPQLHFDDCNM